MFVRFIHFGLVIVIQFSHNYYFFHFMTVTVYPSICLMMGVQFPSLPTFLLLEDSAALSILLKVSCGCVRSFWGSSWQWNCWAMRLVYLQLSWILKITFQSHGTDPHSHLVFPLSLVHFLTCFMMSQRWCGEAALAQYGGGAKGMEMGSTVCLLCGSTEKYV